MAIHPAWRLWNGARDAVALDLIEGAAGADTLYGTTADDLFDGRGGGDTYVPGLESGFDSYADSGSGGIDRILATNDHQTIGLASGFGPDSGIEEISANGHVEVGILGGKGADSFDFSATVLTGIDKISGGSGSDTIIGSAGSDDISGRGGSDHLVGGDGDDSLYGGAQNDLDPIEDADHGRDGSDTLEGNTGNDRLAGGTGADSLIGGTGNDSIIGSGGDDTLLGGQGDDSLGGGEGNDMVLGGGGADTMWGGLGSDVFQFRGTDQTSALINDFTQGEDVIDLSLLDANTNLAGNQTFIWGGQAATAQANSVTYSVAGGVTTVRIDANGNSTADLVLTLTGSLSLTAGDFLL